MIYMDHNATSAVLDVVDKAMKPYLAKEYGNASSVGHAFGWAASEALESSRKSILKNIHGQGKESLIFTSGTTESNNLVIKGLFFSYLRQKKSFHMITQVTEHECVLKACEFIESLGASVTYLKVDAHGLVNPKDLEKALTKDTALVSIMHANNEIGTVQNLAELVAVIKKQEGVFFHSDGAQTVGHLPVDVTTLGLDFLSFSAHKMGGPKGVGALYVSSKVSKGTLTPLSHGGGQEFGLRSGTVNVVGVVGMATALDEAVKNQKESELKIKACRDELLAELIKAIPHSHLNGHDSQRLSGNISLTIVGADSSKLMLATKALAYSSGSACASGGLEPSYVIQALGRSKEEAKCTIRLGLGLDFKKEDIVVVVEELSRAVLAIRNESLEWEMFLSQQ